MRVIPLICTLNIRDAKSIEEALEKAAKLVEARDDIGLIESESVYVDFESYTRAPVYRVRVWGKKKP